MKEVKAENVDMICVYSREADLFIIESFAEVEVHHGVYVINKSLIDIKEKMTLTNVMMEELYTNKHTSISLALIIGLV